jgi:hypothetical protein
MPAPATPADAVAALEDLRDAVRNVLSLDTMSGVGANALRELTTRFDGDLADALSRADKVLDGLIEANELAAAEAEEEE